METADIHILGGGPAGLTTGYYAKKQSLNFLIYEAGANVGGNCRTLQLDKFLFDTGAHRFHDKDPVVTVEVKHLLGDDLLRVEAPSEIFYQDKFYRFPLIMSDLVKKLDTKTLLKIGWDKLRTSNRKQEHNFKELALNKYGKTLAERFLLNYSEKLWGYPTDKLSTAISGNRLKGLDFRNFLRSTVLGTPKSPTHLDGSFYYPKHGIGMIPDKLCEFIGNERIKYNHKVSRLIHKNGRIEKVVLNANVETQVSTVINTLPLTLSMQILEPAPPQELHAIVNTIKYRNLRLCVYCLNKDSFSPNASLYFPSDEFPFTRLYEPKNRSPYMAPEGQTVIVLEIPCFNEDTFWKMSEEALHSKVWEALNRVKLLNTDEIIHYQTYKLPFAYPVLEVGFEEKVGHLVSYFEQFENMYLTGRSSLFQYLHLHDLFKSGREVVEQIVHG
ncbi:NAD(P)-binding protein [Candidatus Poribacteria bacterium]|nr:NAD(P)-binding protein [Candidatus Poribacteria bacterium]